MLPQVYAGSPTSRAGSSSYPVTSTVFDRDDSDWSDSILWNNQFSYVSAEFSFCSA